MIHQALLSCLIGTFFALAFVRAEEGPIDSTDLDALRAAAGKDVAVRGAVTHVGTTADGGITFINIGLPKKKGFVAVVFQKNYGEFPDGFGHFANRTVTVTGNLELYKNEQPQIVVRSASQIALDPEN